MAEMEVQTSVPVVAVTAAVGAIVLLLVMLCSLGRKEEKRENKTEETDENGPTKEKKKQPAKKQRSIDRPRKEAKHNFTHPWLATSLKSHSSPVLGLDCSPNGKYLASCAEDRTILLWSTKEFSQKEHKSIRVNVELDHATQVKFSPDNKALIMSLYNDNTIRVMKMGKKADGTPGNFQTVFDFPKEHGHTSEIQYIGIASSGRFIMTSTKETNIKVWDLKGEILANIDNHQVNTSYAAVSPCGRFIGSSGFTPDVKVWEVSFDKSGAFKDVSRAFDLKGHSAGIYHFSFNSDSTRMATVSKDGTWKVWDTNIEYQKGQEPYLLKTGKCQYTGPSISAISPDGRTVAIGTVSNISIYNVDTTHLAQSFEDVHATPISALGFDNSGKYLVSTGDKHIHVFHNVVGYQAAIVDFQERKKKATNSAQRERLQQQIDEAQEALNSIEGSGDSK